jgi:hypothetical protein
MVLIRYVGRCGVHTLAKKNLFMITILKIPMVGPYGVQLQSKAKPKKKKKGGPKEEIVGK